MYPTKLQLKKANSSDTVAPLVDLKLSTSNGTIFTKMYDKQDDLDLI